MIPFLRSRCVSAAAAVAAIPAALLLPPGTAQGGLRLIFDEARLTKDTRAAFHLELDAKLFEEGGTPHDPADPYSSDEWENEATDAVQTTLTHAHLHEPGDPDSPAPGDPDYWQFNIGIDIADFDFDGDGSNGLFDGVDDARVFILGTHVDGPHDEDVDPQTLPLATSAFGRDKNNDDHAIRLVKSASTLHMTASGKHRDRYSVSMRFIVAQVGLFGVLEELGGDEKEVVVDAAHVSGSRTSLRDGRTFGTTEGAAFFTASTGDLGLSLGTVDIVSSVPTDSAGIDAAYAADPLVGSFFASMNAMYTGLVDGHHRFVPGLGGQLTLVGAGDASFSATWDELFIESNPGEGSALITGLDFSDLPDDNPSVFLGDAVDEHLMNASPSKLGLQIAFDGADLLAVTNGFTQDGFASGFPFTVSGALVPADVPGPGSYGVTVAILALLLAMLVAARRAV